MSNSIKSFVNRIFANQTTTRRVRLLAIALVLGMLAACGSVEQQPDNTQQPQGNNLEPTPVQTTQQGVRTEPAPTQSGTTEAGFYWASIALDSQDGFDAMFYLERTVDENGKTIVRRLTIWAYDVERNVFGKQLVDISDTAPQADGSLSVKLGQITIPEDFNSTGAELKLELTLNAQTIAPKTLCGTLIGKRLDTGASLSDSLVSAIDVSTKQRPNLESCE